MTPISRPGRGDEGEVARARLGDRLVERPARVLEHLEHAGRRLGQRRLEQLLEPVVDRRLDRPRLVEAAPALRRRSRRRARAPARGGRRGEGSRAQDRRSPRCARRPSPRSEHADRSPARRARRARQALPGELERRGPPEGEPAQAPLAGDGAGARQALEECRPAPRTTVESRAEVGHRGRSAPRTRTRAWRPRVRAAQRRSAAGDRRTTAGSRLAAEHRGRRRNSPTPELRRRPMRRTGDRAVHRSMNRDGLGIRRSGLLDRVREAARGRPARPSSCWPVAKQQQRACS